METAIIILIADSAFTLIMGKVFKYCSRQD